MSGKPSSFVKCASVCGALLLLALLLVRSRPEAADSPASTTVPLDRLLDLPIKFRFLMRPESACDETKRLLVFVHSRVAGFGARKTIRATWGAASLQAALHFRLVFLVGLQERESDRVERLLGEEQRLHDDLVRGNFVDTYRNLTYKHLSGFKYVLHHCPNASFVMKTDDDAFINIFAVADLLDIADTQDSQQGARRGYGEVRLLNAIGAPDRGEGPTYRNQRRSLAGHRRTVRSLTERKLKFIACSLFPVGTKTRRTGKWSLTREEYGPDRLPAYCSGKTGASRARVRGVRTEVSLTKRSLPPIRRYSLLSEPGRSARDLPDGPPDGKAALHRRPLPDRRRRPASSSANKSPGAPLGLFERFGCPERLLTVRSSRRRATRPAAPFSGRIGVSSARLVRALQLQVAAIHQGISAAGR